MKFNSRQGLIASIAGGAVAVVFVLGFTTLEITSQPFFCSTCHYMQGYYKQWKTSSHKKVNCLSCHAKPGIGNYLKRKFAAVHEVASMVTGKYPPRPHAEVDDASCLRPGCHETRLLKGKVNFKGVIFDHTPHLTKERRGRTLRCTSCHAQMAMGRHIAVTEETCFLCHFKGRSRIEETSSSKFCLKCHKVPDTTITIRNTSESFTHSDYMKTDVKCQHCHAGVIRGTGQVPKMMCFQCHNKPENIEKINDLVFIHENHITKHKVECYLCHTEIEHSLVSTGASDSLTHQGGYVPISTCGRCHGTEHLASRLLYEGKGGKGVPEMQSSMARAHVDCLACHHVKSEDSSGLMVERQFPRAGIDGCVMCHGDDGKSYYNDWQVQIRQELASATNAFAKVSGLPKTALDAEALKQLEEARFNIQLVKAGRGIHNIEYATSLLQHSREMAEKIGESAKK